MRTNLRFLARRVVPQLCPADAPLPRERAKVPYSPAEIAGYLALAAAQPTAARRMRAAGLVCAGAGAGLIRADLRHIRGSDICCRSGGVLVTVRGARPRTVPVLARYHQPLLASAQFAGDGLVTGGADPARRNLTTPLLRALDGGTGLPRLDTSRLRATWLAGCAAQIGLATFMHAAGITCSQRLGDLLPRHATPDQITAHDTQAAELARHKLGRISADDADGYHRVTCPAAMRKIRCPLRPSSMTLDRSRPEILNPPENPPACCTQQTITVPPQVTAKTRQKHDYPSPAHRRSYARRTGSERTFATLKDPATSNIARGWCRLTGLTPLHLWLACLLTIRNQRILDAWNTRQAENNQRAAAGLPPKTRRRRRKTLATLAAAPP